MRITRKILEREDACESEVADFEIEWPNGANITLKNIRRAQELGLDIEWVVFQFMSKRAQQRFADLEHEWGNKRVGETVTEEEWEDSYALNVWEAYKVHKRGFENVS